MNILQRHSILFHFLSFSFIFFHFLSFSFFIFCHFLSLFLVLLFSGAQNPLIALIASRFLIKALVQYINFLGRLGRYPIGPSFFLLSFFHVFHFRFQFLYMFFLFFLFQFLFPYFPFVFSPPKKIHPFSFCFSFFLFTGAQNLWQHSRIPLGKLHILSWLYLLCIGSSSLFPVE